MTILIVDDEPGIRGMLAAILNAEGYDVTAVGDGPSALRAIASGAPDLMLVDIMMPGMDGRQLVSTVREELRLNVPVIFMSAAGNAGQVREQGDTFLAKPFELDRLLSVVESKKA